MRSNKITDKSLFNQNQQLKDKQSNKNKINLYNNTIQMNNKTQSSSVAAFEIKRETEKQNNNNKFLGNGKDNNNKVINKNGNKKDDSQLNNSIKKNQFNSKSFSNNPNNNQFNQNNNKHVNSKFMDISDENSVTDSQEVDYKRDSSRINSIPTIFLAKIQNQNQAVQKKYLNKQMDQNYNMKQKKDGNQDESQKRYKQNIVVYILLVLATAISGPQVIFWMDNKIDQLTYNIIAVIALSFKLFVWILVMIEFILKGKGIRILKLFLLVDNILVAQVGASYVLIQLMIIESKGYIQTIQIFFFISIAIISHFQSSAFRTIMVFCQWNKYQMLFYKLTISSCCVCNFAYGCFFYLQEQSRTNGQDLALDRKLKEFIILFAFMAFGYYYQIHGGIAEFDGSSNLQFKYGFREDPNLKQYENNQNNNDNVIDDEIRSPHQNNQQLDESHNNSNYHIKITNNIKMKRGVYRDSKQKQRQRIRQMLKQNKIEQMTLGI